MDNASDMNVSAQLRAYKCIRDDLLAGEFEPGEKLRIDDVSDRYGVGLSPVREALSRLSETGLIVALPQRGYRVATISSDEYTDLVEMRLRLEPDALRNSILNADIDWEARVAAGYQRLASTQRNMKAGSTDGGQKLGPGRPAISCGSDFKLYISVDAEFLPHDPRTNGALPSHQNT